MSQINNIVEENNSEQNRVHTLWLILYKIPN